MRISEGQSFSRRFAVLGSAGAPIFQANGLPEGATFNVNSGVFSYTPSFDTTNRTRGSASFEAELIARSGGQQTSMTLQIEVLDVNRAPEVLFDGPRLIDVRLGEKVTISLQGRDADAFDQTVVAIAPSPTGTFAGNLATQQAGSTQVVTLEPTALGTFSFILSAQDLDGAISTRSLQLNVLPANAAPIVTAPDSFTLTSTGVPLVLEANDPEGQAVTFDFLGLPSASIVTLSTDQAIISLDPSALDAPEFLIQVFVSDGVHVVQQPIKVARAPSLSVLPGAENRWPGESGRRQENASFIEDGRQVPITVYDPQTGMWRHTDCRGTEVVERQFGGFIGDQPLAITSAGEKRRGIYRTLQGQGYWFVQRESGAEQVAWGLDGDIPVPGDFDGDGEGDFAVFRPSDSLTGKDTWYIKFSAIPTQSLSDTQLGAASSKLRIPYAADVDGDSLDDRILFSRKTDGSALVHVWFASGQRQIFSLGQVSILSAVVPVVGDFDGDSRSEFAVRLSTGEVRGLSSSTASVFSRTFAAGQSAVLSTAECGTESPSGIAMISREGEAIEVFAPALGTSVQSFDAKPIRDLGLKNLRTLESAAAQFATKRVQSSFADLDGDGRSNFVVRRSQLRESRGNWLERESLRLGRNFAPIDGALGQLGSGDFSGHGAAELSFFNNGLWTIQRNDGSTRRELWGVEGDEAVPEDYNGDAQSELAVFRPADGSWWMLSKGQNGDADAAMLTYWGEGSDLAVPADYDGDGAADIAIWRPSNGQWFIRYADGAVEVLSFGGRGDVPLPGDYLGEGKAQLAVWRPSLGLWIIRRGERAEDIIVVPWGLSSDIPLRGDFDGDGRQDLLVWRESEGAWYLRRLDSLDPSARVVQFGLPGDSPLGLPSLRAVF